MREIDQMDVLRYFDVLAREQERRDNKEDEDPRGDGGPSVTLRRGTIDMVLG